MPTYEIWDRKGESWAAFCTAVADRSPLSNFPGSDFPVATLFMSRASKLASGQTGPMANLEQWNWKGVGSGQHLSCKMDSDQEDFFQWKAKLELEFRKQPEKKPVFELVKSLGLRMDISDFKMPNDSEEKKKPPSNQRIKEINKQRELDEAQKELVEMQTKLEQKLALIGERWRKVETGQKLLKQNLVKYNNFVREKRGKVADEISRRMSEKQRQQEKKKTALRSSIDNLVSRA